MKNKFFSGLIILAVVITMSSCNKVPQAEIDAVNQLISDAQFAGADQYLPQEYAALVDSMNALTVKFEAKKSKWFAKYTDETKKLEDVKVLASSVKENTQMRIEELKAEIQQAISDVQITLNENRELLTKAPKGKEGKAALEAIKVDLTVAEGSLNEAMALVSQGKLIEAQSKVNAANEKALSINMELNNAIAKYNKHK